MVSLPYHDRRAAGAVLAGRLLHLAGHPGVVVLGLPRGGVPVAAAVAQALGAPLDVFTVRKLGVPGHEEFAMGAIATGGTCVLDDATVRDLGITPAQIAAVRGTETRELGRRERLFRGDRPPLDVRGATVILVDDGMATGTTMRAAVAALRSQHLLHVIVAVPVASDDALAAVQAVADAVICPLTPTAFLAVGAWYDDFEQTSDAEVRRLLEDAQAHLPEDARAGALAARRNADQP